MKKGLGLLFIVVVGSYYFSNKSEPTVSEVKAQSRAEQIELVFKKSKKTEKKEIKNKSQIQYIPEPSSESASKASQQKFFQAMKIWKKDRTKYFQLLRESIQLDSNNVKALGRYSASLLSEGKTEKSREYARKCLAIDPTHSECNTALISSFTRFGEFEKGYDHILNCLENDPENTQCISGLISTLLNLNDLEAAEELISQLQDLEVEDIWLALALGQYYQRVGDHLLAYQNYELACNKGQAFACKMVKQLKSKI